MPGNNTLLGGTGLVLRPFGRTVEDMTVAANTGMKLSLQARGGSRLQQIRELRRAIADVRDYLDDYNRKKAEFDKEKAAGAIEDDKQWEQEIDRKKQAAVDLIEKKLKGWLYVPSFAELRRGAAHEPAARPAARARQQPRRGGMPSQQAEERRSCSPRNLEYYRDVTRRRARKSSSAPPRCSPTPACRSRCRSAPAARPATRGGSSAPACATASTSSRRSRR